MCFNIFLFLKDLVLYTSSSSERIKAYENEPYLPADLGASPTSTLLSTIGEDEPRLKMINNLAYTSVTFSSLNYGNVIRNTLSGSHDNLLETEEVPESTNLYTQDPTDLYHGENTYEAVYIDLWNRHDLHSKSKNLYCVWLSLL